MSPQRFTGGPRQEQRRRQWRLSQWRPDRRNQAALWTVTSTARITPSSPASPRAGRHLHRLGPRPHVANDRLRHMLIGYARVSKTDGSQSLDSLGLATAGPLVGTGLTGRKAARTLESLCFAGSAPGPRCSLSYARLWRAWGRASSKHQPTPTPVRTRPRMSSTTRRHTESTVPGRPPSRPSRSVWSANGLARGGHPLSASLTMRLTSPQYG